MEEKYEGMTVNERLFVTGLMNEFDDAINKKDITKLTSILKLVDLDDKNIDNILKHYNLSQ